MNRSKQYFIPSILKSSTVVGSSLVQKEGSEFQVDVIPLDRIEGKITVEKEFTHLPSETGFYTKYFGSIVGVTHEKGRKNEHITIKTQSRYVHGLMKTKPIHSSFSEVASYSYHDDENTLMV